MKTQTYNNLIKIDKNIIILAAYHKKMNETLEEVYYFWFLYL